MVCNSTVSARGSGASSEEPPQQNENVDSSRLDNGDYEVPKVAMPPSPHTPGLSDGGKRSTLQTPVSVLDSRVGGLATPGGASTPVGDLLAEDSDDEVIITRKPRGRRPKKNNFRVPGASSDKSIPVYEDAAEVREKQAEIDEVMLQIHAVEEELTGREMQQKTVRGSMAELRQDPKNQERYDLARLAELYAFFNINRLERDLTQLISVHTNINDELDRKKQELIAQQQQQQRRSAEKNRALQKQAANVGGTDVQPQEKVASTTVSIKMMNKKGNPALEYLRNLSHRSKASSHSSRSFSEPSSRSSNSSSSSRRQSRLRQPTPRAQMVVRLNSHTQKRSTAPRVAAY